MSNEQALSEHLEALRKALAISFSTFFIISLICFTYSSQILFALISSVQKHIPHAPPPLCLSPLEGILSQIKLSLYAALALSSPILFSSLLHFILPALKPREKWITYAIISSAFFSTIAGFYLSYNSLVPLLSKFLWELNEKCGLQNAWSISELIELIVLCACSSIFIFTLFASTLFLIFYGTITAKHLQKVRKAFYLFSLIFAAFVTPPDVLSQLALAIPMLIAFEALRGLAKLKFHLFSSKR